jgi:hypothetical protein
MKYSSSYLRAPHWALVHGHLGTWAQMMSMQPCLIRPHSCMLSVIPKVVSLLPQLKMCHRHDLSKDPSPVMGLHLRDTQGSDSQSLGVPPHTPLVHTSPTVQLSVSLHRVPSVTLTRTQVPVH